MEPKMTKSQRQTLALIETLETAVSSLVGSDGLVYVTSTIDVTDSAGHVVYSQTRSRRIDRRGNSI